jgi:hypothetical protein
MKPPVILDLDQSLGEFPGQIRVPMQDWHEKLRFACSAATLGALREELDRRLPARHGTVLFGSGDFHHLSWPLIERCAAHGPFQVVVLDNHPDNMRFPFGVHCGSWVRRVAALECVSDVHVVGITSSDIGLAHAWENSLLPLLRGRLTYWSIGVDVRWAAALGLAGRFRSFAGIDALVATFAAEQERSSRPTYLSIDKDVFASDLVRTNWDQGCMRLEHARTLIAALQGGIIGSDINGEVSTHAYRSWWKRRLTAIDGQAPVPGERLAEWRVQHHALNRALLAAIAGCSRSTGAGPAGAAHAP